MRNGAGVCLILVCAIASAQTVTYPLAVGDRWEFDWAMTGEPGYPPAPAIVLGDSTMPNGLRYTLIRYTDSSIVAERQLGDSVFRFDAQLQDEYLLFDFRAAPGDTIGRIGDQDIVFEKSDTAFVVDAQRRRWLFTIYPPGRPVDTGRYIWVTDSLGVSRIVTSWGNYRNLYGACINGRKYGTISFVNERGNLEGGATSSLDAYPNPFNASLRIAIGVLAPSRVRLEVFNSLGQQMAMIADQIFDKGVHHFVLEASRWASGTYFLRALIGGHCQSAKVLLVK
jgi:hypothetical protein